MFEDEPGGGAFRIAADLPTGRAGDLRRDRAARVQQGTAFGGSGLGDGALASQAPSSAGEGLGEGIVVGLIAPEGVLAIEAESMGVAADGESLDGAGRGDTPDHVADNVARVNVALAVCDDAPAGVREKGKRSDECKRDSHAVQVGRETRYVNEIAEIV